MMQAIFVLALVVLAHGVFRLNDRRHRFAALQNILALRHELKAVTAMYEEKPNGSCLASLDHANMAEFGASVYLVCKRFAKAEAEAEVGFRFVQAAREALIFSKPEFRVLATGCRG